MTDYLKLLEEQQPEPKQSKDWLGMLSGNPQQPKVERYFEPTGETSTVTGEPVRKMTGNGGPGASYWAHVKAGFVDDPLTKVKIYAADRFPDLTETERISKYKIVNGEIVYEDFDGKLYSESPDLFDKKLKRFLGDTTANLPSEVLGTAGAATFGAPGAFFGSAAGEGYRKFIGAAMGEPQGSISNALDMTEVGLLGVAGEAVGGYSAKKTSKGLSTLTGGMKGRRLAQVTGKEMPFIDFKKAAQIQKRIKDEFGVELFDAQTTESRRLIEKIKLYGDIPDLMDSVKAAKRIQDEQAYTAVDRFWDFIYKVDDEILDSYTTGQELVDTTNKIVERKINSARAKAAPHYKKAFDSNIKIDVTPHIRELNELASKWPEGSAERNKILGYARMLLREEKVGGKTVMIPEDRMRVLDRLKKITDNYLKPAANEQSVTKDVKRDILRVKNNILADMDKASPDYQAARRIFGDDAETISRMTKKTTFGNIANLEGDRVAQAGNMIFKTYGKSPYIVKKMRSEIIKENPGVWEKALRGHLEDIWDSGRKSMSGDGAKEFNNFWLKAFGDEKQAKILKSAMSEQQWNRFQMFGDMLRRVGLISGKESATATRQLALKQEVRTWSKVLQASTRPLFTYKRLVADKFNDFATKRGQKRLLEALLNPSSRPRIDHIKKLGPNTIKGMKAMGTFLSLVAGGEYMRNGTELMQAH